MPLLHHKPGRDAVVNAYETQAQSEPLIAIIL